MATSDAASFDDLMGRLRAGEDAAAAQLYSRCADRLVGLAGSRLDSTIRQKVGPLDVVQSAMKSFFVRNAAGQFEIRDWESLWTLLTVITVRKCVRQARRFRCARRDVRREAALRPASDHSKPRWELASADPTPSQAAVRAETLEQLMTALEPRDRQILGLRLQGYTVREISERVGYAERTVHRVLTHVRSHLEAMRNASDE